METATSLPDHPCRERQHRLRQALAEVGGADAMLVTNPVNIRYLTGFAGTSQLLVTGDETLLVTDFRYVEVARAMRTADGGPFAVEAAPSGAAQLAVLHAHLPAADRLVVEAEHVTLERADALRAGLPGIELVPTTRLVARQRLVKDDAEIARLRRAAAIADAAFAAVLDRIRPGSTTERDVADWLATLVREHGADGEAFPTIVAAGETGGSPHSVPTDRRIAAGEPVIIDFGAAVDGYRSDMTRTIWFGTLAPEASEVYGIVRRAQAQGVGAATAGQSHAGVDRACREAIGSEGHAEHFTHPTGHNVGLDIHELPYLTATATDLLHEGQVITVEPGVYLPGRFGVRIEDMGVVGPGAFDVLTRTPKLEAPVGL